MKKFLISFAVLVFLVPSVSFAQTTSTSSQVSILLQLVTLLTQEVSSLQAQLASYQNAPVTTPSVPVATSGLSAQMGRTSALFQANHSFNSTALGVGNYNLYFNVTAGSQTIFVPLTIGTTATSGVAYIIASPNQSQTQPTVTISVQCSGSNTSTVYADVGYCKIPAGQTAQFSVSASIPAPTGSSYGINVSEIGYKTDPLSASYSSYTPSQKIATSLLSFTAN